MHTREKLISKSPVWILTCFFPNLIHIYRFSYLQKRQTSLYNGTLAHNLRDHCIY